MILTLLFILLALLALSFLIFIHELGHYWMAKRVGMRVETFSIGFGKPIYSWQCHGTTWQVGWLPLFGGFVKIAGYELEKGREGFAPDPESFYAKSPWERIKVAFMGPLMNLAFALLAFILLWAMGGQEVRFSDYTAKIGWIDPSSELYARGVRPGDEVVRYDSHPFSKSRDHKEFPLLAEERLLVEGNHVDYATGERRPFRHEVALYPHPAAFDKGTVTAGILDPAGYLIYKEPIEWGDEGPSMERAPIVKSGIAPGDRVVWADGELLFSVQQLNELLAEGRALLTISREGETLLMRVPRLPLGELKLNSNYREELVDWQYEAGLNTIKFADLVVIPYDITVEGVVEAPLQLIDVEGGEELFPTHPFSQRDKSLFPGDKIVAVDGTPVQYGYQILEQLQHHEVHLIVERREEGYPAISWREADAAFDATFDLAAIEALASSIGQEGGAKQMREMVLLEPVEPKKLEEFLNAEQISAEWEKKRRRIESIDDPERRAQVLQLLKKNREQPFLGLAAQDRVIIYNPLPTELFVNVVKEIWRVLSALLTGALSLKWVSGPVGIVQIVHSHFVSAKDALYWLGAISLNLGIINLLPIPVLDGGTILFSLYEMVTRRRLHPKTMEKLIIPFALLLIAFFLYLTYNDIARIIQQILHW